MSAKTEVKTGVIEGVLVYAKLAQPDFKYQSKDKEYIVGVLVDEDAADAWDEQFTKQTATKVKSADFKDKYKFDNPFTSKYVYEIKLKRDATKDGEAFNPEFRPKVFLDTNDGQRLDITESRLIANGSKGKVSYRINSNDYGTFARLSNVLVEEDTFIEFKLAGGNAGDEFGKKEVVKEPARKQATEARKEKTTTRESKKTSKKEVEDFDDDIDDSLPF